PPTTGRPDATWTCPDSTTPYRKRTEHRAQDRQKQFAQNSGHYLELYMTQVNTYGVFLHNAPQINLLLKNIRGDVHWDNVDEPKKSRHIVVTRQVDFDRDHWDDLNAWLVQGLLIMHTIVDQFDE
ncbi:hypothetical protein, partial [Bifidobacterium mongoliense]|uniref:hypothetical protein n=1 Tax=Bifidobacterium mongoliense TaxID=518643 RepID=UPI0030ED57D0